MLDMFNLNGKRALVVGGAGDLGSAITEGLLEAGAFVVAVDIDQNVHRVAQEFQKKGLKAASLQVDISDRDAIKKSVIDAEILLNGSIDILVNSAGIQRRNPSEFFSEKDWDDVISINLTATFIYCQQVAPKMIENGYGKIINVASIMSFFGGITIPAYAASKGGVAQLTKALSNDWASKGICVNAIAPGYIDTRLNTALINDTARSSEVLLRTPMKRWGVSSDMKGVAIFLSSAASDFISGVVLPVDGGYSAR
jgi:2-deoxy-D-gluconate 3-dehydrogenase